MPLPIELDHDRGVPVYRQIYEAVVRALTSGVLDRGEQLPTIHQLAARLEVNPNTVARSYRDLERDGHIFARRGRGTFPARGPAPEPEARKAVVEEIVARAVREAARHGIDRDEIVRHLQRTEDEEPQ
jgi:GntR family transcriptional regulator